MFAKRRRQSPIELRLKKVRILRDCLRLVCQESKISINRQPLLGYVPGRIRAAGLPLRSSLESLLSRSK